MALNLEEERKAALRGEEVHARCGHPGERLMALLDRIRAERVRDFADITDEFLALMWCLDQYRVADAAPVGMGRQAATYRSRIDGVYRGKGNWFAILLTHLLMNRTGETIRSRSKIRVSRSRIRSIWLGLTATLHPSCARSRRSPVDRLIGTIRLAGRWTTGRTVARS